MRSARSASRRASSPGSMRPATRSCTAAPLWRWTSLAPRSIALESRRSSSAVSPAAADAVDAGGGALGEPAAVVSSALRMNFAAQIVEMSADGVVFEGEGGDEDDFVVDRVHLALQEGRVLRVITEGGSGGYGCWCCLRIIQVSLRGRWLVVGRIGRS